MPDDHDLVVAMTQHLQQPAQRSGRAATWPIGEGGGAPVRTGLAFGAASGNPAPPDADRPVACLLGCHLDAVRVKAAARPCGMACGQP
jgi:hypothetical protein